MGQLAISLCLALTWAMAVTAQAEPAAILTPPESPTPQIHGARVFGVRPGAPLIYLLPVTGQRPMHYAVDDLPTGLQLDAATGIITGALQTPGEFRLTVRANNALGAAERPLRLIVGDSIALTPPMGWNSWNCWGGSVSQEKVLTSAHALATSGLREHGWSYVNVDDAWQGLRGGEFNAIQPNSKFPDMKALGAEIHALGLRFGIYSSPWRGTYEGHIGSSSDNEDGTYPWLGEGDHTEYYSVGKDPRMHAEKKKTNWQLGRHSFAEQDAKQWAQWGVDYLKYDWFPNDVPSTAEMAKALRASGRDIVYSLSNTAPYDHAATLASLANAWRTTGDIQDTWESVSRIGFSQDRWAPYAGPGHWNDPDMLVVGQVGWGPKLKPTRLTPDEQYTHFSLWCLLSAPLLLGCDLAQLDPFTRNLLTNDEVIEIDQDPLGKQATQVSHEGDKAIYVKFLEGGDIAVGLFNRGGAETKITVRLSPWGEIAMPEPGHWRVRDLWRQQDLGTFEGKFESAVPAHGVVLVRLSAVKP